MTWLLLAFASALSLGGYEISRKTAVEDNAVLPVLFLSHLGGLVLLSCVLVGTSLVPGLAQRTGFSLVTLSGFEHFLVCIKAAIVTSSWLCAFFAVKHLPISISAPLRSLSPVLTVLGAFVLFREAPTALQFVGMATIVSGYLGFAWLGRAEGIVFHTDRWIGLLLLGTCIGAISGLYDKFLLQKAAIPPTTLQLWFTVYNVVLQGTLVATLWRRWRREQPLSWRSSIPLVGALLVLADQFYFRALAYPDALVSVVALIRRASVVVSFTLGGLLFREQLLKKKALLLLVVLCGVALLFVEAMLDAT